MTSVAMIIRLFVRNENTRANLFAECLSKSDQISDVHDSALSSEFGVKQWTGLHLQKYLSLFESLNLDEIELQVLFEKRSSTGSEKFPAQVSLPGGKPEGNENLLETAIRETFEETSLNLTEELDFVYLGEFPSVLPFMKIKKVGSIYVKAFVFVQISFDPIPMFTQPGEIDEWMWTSIDYIRQHPQQFYVDYSCLFFPNTDREFQWVLPTVLLFDSEKYSVDDLMKNPEFINKDFKLWGLTLFFIIGKHVADNVFRFA